MPGPTQTQIDKRWQINMTTGTETSSREAAIKIYPRKVPLFYHPEMHEDAFGIFGPHTTKPRLTIKDWFKSAEVLLNVQCMPVTRLTHKAFCLVHDPAYVSEVFYQRKNWVPDEGNYLNPFENAATYTSGAMLAASRYVLENGGVACVPASGFSGAYSDHSERQCMFNTPVVTATVMLGESLVRRILILDFDQVCGNGTAELLDYHPMPTIGGMPTVDHITAKKQYSTAEQSLEVSRSIGDVLYSGGERKYDLVLYQAGACVNEEDPTLCMTIPQLQERDGNIFRACLSSGTPVVWNFAAPYHLEHDAFEEQIVKAHRNTMLECIRASNDTLT